MHVRCHQFAWMKPVISDKGNNTQQPSERRSASAPHSSCVVFQARGIGLVIESVNAASLFCLSATCRASSQPAPHRKRTLHDRPDTQEPEILAPYQNARPFLLEFLN